MQYTKYNTYHKIQKYKHTKLAIYIKTQGTKFIPHTRDHNIIPRISTIPILTKYFKNSSKMQQIPQHTNNTQITEYINAT